MGLGDIFKANENDQLKAKIQELESSFNSERNQLQPRNEVILCQKQNAAPMGAMAQK